MIMSLFLILIYLIRTAQVTRRAWGSLCRAEPQEAFAEFKKILAVSQDPKTQLVTVSVRHKSPAAFDSGWSGWLRKSMKPCDRKTLKRLKSLLITLSGR